MGLCVYRWGVDGGWVGRIMERMSVGVTAHAPFNEHVGVMRVLCVSVLSFDDQLETGIILI